MHKIKRARLVLENGAFFSGNSLGADGERFGEVVFNTAMTGYQEIITDPSYKGQIVAMTCPLIGNYGINDEDNESRQPWLEGFIAKEFSRVTSNWRAKRGLIEYLNENKIMAVDGIDTRALTRAIRTKGAMQALLTTSDEPLETLVSKIETGPKLLGVDLVKEVTVSEPYVFCDEGKYKVVVIDCGVKTNILRRLSACGCRVHVVPYHFSASDIKKLSPDGVFVSNGPGDPAAVAYVPETLRNLFGEFPIFGICLGHQMLGIALGGKTFKLKFGHHGGNHPVKDLRSGIISITSQNHGFCVDPDSLGPDIEITHVNLNDNTVEGICHKKMPIMSIQCHPEAGPGPHDEYYLFDEFYSMMEKFYA